MPRDAGGARAHARDDGRQPVDAPLEAAGVAAAHHLRTDDADRGIDGEHRVGERDELVGVRARAGCEAVAEVRLVADVEPVDAGMMIDVEVANDIGRGGRIAALHVDPDERLGADRRVERDERIEVRGRELPAAGLRAAAARPHVLLRRVPGGKAQHAGAERAEPRDDVRGHRRRVVLRSPVGDVHPEETAIDTDGLARSVWSSIGVHGHEVRRGCAARQILHGLRALRRRDRRAAREGRSARTPQADRSVDGGAFSPTPGVRAARASGLGRDRRRR